MPKTQTQTHTTDPGLKLRLLAYARNVYDTASAKFAKDPSRVNLNQLISAATYLHTKQQSHTAP
ncbi:hypothetical protein [Pantanalinema sp. GBBB05]|uniref:hypothetical protein n=1 Tax=Pantanalinema sp. GBBB05 TaxID=2604139 RepID=UPI001E030347|nr:hypothetical protein [Pantanalinema sp. GBBB05]